MADRFYAAAALPGHAKAVPDNEKYGQAQHCYCYFSHLGSTPTAGGMRARETPRSSGQACS
jgi:hypothetical protein